MKKRISLLLVVVVVSGCSSGPIMKDNKPPALRLSKIEKIGPGKQNRADIISQIGNPDGRFPLEKQPELNDNGEIWIYYDGPQKDTGRLSLYFPKGSETVGIVSWSVREGDPEKELKRAKYYLKGRFKNIDLRITEQQQLNPHAWSNEKYYEDDKLGAGLVYQSATKKVTSIVWGDPKILATLSRNPPRQLGSVHCLEGVCVPVSDTKEE